MNKFNIFAALFIGADDLNAQAVNTGNNGLGGLQSPLLLGKMIVTEIENIVSTYLEGKEYFLVEVQMKKGNVINVFVDGDKGVNIDDCVKISRFIESKLDRDKEDYELRVSSPGIDKPFKLKRQYNKYIGREITVLTADIKIFEGSLVSVNDEEIALKIKHGKKGNEMFLKSILFSEITEARPVISFKTTDDITK